MSGEAKSPQDQTALLKRALVEIKELRSRLDLAELSKSEPIAIIGLGCRFPGGANDPESFWRLLQEGRDAVSEVPLDRWNAEELYDADPSTVGRLYTRHGAFLDVDVAAWCPEFFGVAPREAISMDPQQRLLLEVTWEALENAGQAPSHWRGKTAGESVGVFVGISTSDYGQVLDRPNFEHIDAYSGTGNSDCIAAGRLSYLLGFEGPNLAVDTACSSSLIAIHLACQSLRSRECEMALAGGVNLMLAPEATLYFCKLHALSVDGRSKTFDAAADGYGRGEGCGVVVLKRLSDAIASGDSIRAVILGSATNHDGRSNGLTAPNEAAQVAVLREALKRARVAPQEVGYVEAHGTGTPLGDPIEVGALRTVLAPGREQPLYLGSAKTNIGHLEAAAGVAGLIKTVLALEHREIPPHLHLERLNPYLPMDAIPAVVPLEPTAWPTIAGRRIAGISSFGFSGSNAHLVVSEAPVMAEAKRTLTTPAASAEPNDCERRHHLFTASAKSESALREVVRRWGVRLSADGGDAPRIEDLCLTANAGRSVFEHRFAVVARDTATLAERLAQAAAGRGQNEPDVARGQVVEGKRPEIVFLFTGQGSQVAGMGRELYESEPSFRATLGRCAELLRPTLAKPLLSVLWGDDVGLLDETAYTQPALFALEYSLAELLRSWGIEPTAVLGHSVGEYVAACVAGIFSLEDALGLIAERGRLMQELPRVGGIGGIGAMAAVWASAERVARAIEPYSSEVSIAAVNGPQATVISGLASVVGMASAEFAAAGIEVRPLNVSHAFHSPLMDPMLDPFEAAARRVSFAAPEIDFVSNLTGELARGEVTTAKYWRDHVRRPVEFARGIAALDRAGYRLFVEIGPTPVLTGLARRCLPESRIADFRFLPTLRKGVSEGERLLQTVGELFVRGVAFDPAGLHRDGHAKRIAMPTYPFERERYWVPEDRARARFVVNPLLGERLLSATTLSEPRQGEGVASANGDTVSFRADLSTRSVPFLADHRVHGVVVLPATAYIEIALSGALAAFGAAPAVWALEDLYILQAITVPSEAPAATSIQLDLRREAGAVLWNLVDPTPASAAGGPELFATGRLVEWGRAEVAALPEPPVLAAERERFTEQISV